jgi:hypothetical protein
VSQGKYTAVVIAMSGRHRLERMPNGLLRVFDLSSQLAGCYHVDGTYAYGDLRAATLRDLLVRSQGARSPKEAMEH